MRLPDFIIAGAPRAGTTWLYQVLDLHPGIYMAKPLRPEPKFFLRDDLFALGLNQYARWFEAARPGQICGEKSTNYLESAVAAERIASSVPYVKLIFLLRDPIERAWSNYLWSRMNGLETLDFAEAIEQEAERERRYSPEHHYSRPYSYLSRGLYAGLLEPYLCRFAADRMLVLRFEDIGANGGAIAAQVHRFLGIPERKDDGLGVPAANASDKSDGRSLPLPLRRRLEEYYSEPNRLLQAMVGRHRAFWEYGSA